ncbi:hypothetical protein BH10ACI3_BH10ACI3_06820 [soil metagenome]
MKTTRTFHIKAVAASLLALLVISVAIAARPEVTSKAIDLNTSENMMADGGSDYATYCTRCHGGDGRGQTAKGRQTHAGDLTKSSVSDAKGIRMITNGSGEMPDFKSSMSAAQIKAVMAYTHGFRR